METGNISLPERCARGTTSRRLKTACVIQLLALLAAWLPAVAQAQFLHTTNNGTITITGYTGPGGDVSIPDTINGRPVTTIWIYAFRDHTNLTSILIPDSVTDIGPMVFAGCTRLGSADLGGVTNVSSQLFSDCRSLTNVTIPASVTSIENGAFYFCTSLASISIPSSVTSIGPSAFYFCTSMASFTIPNGVTNIGDFAFNYCTSLTNIIIPRSVTRIGYAAFANCRSLVAITVDAANSNYGSLDGVLFNKSGTTLIQYPGKKAGIYTIPSSVASIGRSAFYNCPSLTSVTIPSSVTNIGNFAFQLCTSLVDVTIPSSVTTIGDYVFSDCASFVSVTIPNSVTSIGERAYAGCTRLATVTIPSSVTNIGSRAFVGCISLMAITVDAGNSDYGSLDGVLFDKSRTTLIQYPGSKTGNYTIPSSVTSIGVSAFANCSSLTAITIPHSVIGIGPSAFYYCIRLASVTIPSSVTSIEEYAFYGCLAMETVYFQGNAPSVSPSAFGGDNFATLYFLPGTTGWEATFGGRPTALWLPQVSTGDAGFGVRTNQFGFNIYWASGRTVVVEACEDLANSIWTPAGTNTLTEGSSYFSDPQWTNSPARFYRLREP